jgi:hypothetical protein
LATADYQLTFNIYDAATNGALVWGPQVSDSQTAQGHGPEIPVVQGGRAYEGDAVRSIYLDRRKRVPVPELISRTNILSWRSGFGDCRWPMADGQYGALGICQCLNRQEKTSGHEGRHQGNGFLPMLSEEAEMAVHGADGEGVVQFRQSDDAGVGEVHRGICIGMEQLCNGREFVPQGHWLEATACNGLNHFAARNPLFRNQMADFCQHGLADNGAGCQFGKNPAHPGVVFILFRFTIIWESMIVIIRENRAEVIEIIWERVEPRAA